MSILQALYFFLPAYLANMAPVFAQALFPKYNMPIDGGKTFRGRRVLGDHKTWRGLIAGIVVGMIVVMLQAGVLSYELFESLSILDYQNYNLFVLGVLFGGGALVGDAVKSFFKRQIGKKSGEQWIGFDQLDFVVGGLFFVGLVYVPQAEIVLILLVITPLLHWVTNVVGYTLGLKEVPW
jgi:CDP-2,3-bis-(O-geranylgeranyl)-sn-glycerol synthase